MTLDELKNVVDSLLESGHSPDAEVRLAYQRHYPMQDEVAGVATLSDATDDSDMAGTERDAIYLVSGGQLQDDPYAPRGVWDVAQS
jgi:precorrin-4 methylase